jgi:hypothetical protein
MRGNWKQVRGTIVESPDAPPGATEPTLTLLRDNHDYVVEVAGPKGQLIRGTVGMVSMFVHAVGEPMAVEVNFKTGEMQVDKQAEAVILKQQAATKRLEPRVARETPLPSSAASTSAPRLSMTESDAASGAGTVEQRLTRLKLLVDKGILTESEYQAKRAQMLNEL